MLKRRGKTLKNQAELSWETGPLLCFSPKSARYLNLQQDISAIHTTITIHNLCNTIL